MRRSVTPATADPRTRVAGVVLAAVLSIGTIGYMVLGLGLLDALYQTAITVTTVGYGEVGAGSDPSTSYRVFTLLLVLVGTASVVFAAGVMVESMIERRLGVFHGRRMQREIDKMTDHVIVAGYGRVGAVVVERATALGGGIVVIDIDPEAVRSLTHPFLVGDATSDLVLEQAGVRRARSLVCALASDAANLFLAVSARQINPDLRIVSRANAVDAAHKLRSIELDTVVDPYAIAGDRLATAALRPHTADYLDQVFSAESDKVELTEVVVHGASSLVDRPVSDAEALGVVVVALRAHGQLEFVGPTAHGRPLRAGDVLIALGDRSTIGALLASARGGAGP